MIPPTLLVRSANQNRFAIPSHEAVPAALPVSSGKWLIENENPHPSVCPSGLGANGVGFASSGFATGLNSLQSLGRLGI